ncbi:MAG TPA: DUF1573 domain-containing protein [Phycisphaerae bacterium]|nr:DUF1573 domain-containing protein [Phycisphaerae bacterium]HUU21536.1 DUF1573 domain-containing protein [Phycisphaerae bacterium]
MTAIVSLAVLLAAAGCSQQPVVLALGTIYEDDGPGADGLESTPRVIVGGGDAEGEYDLDYVEKDGLRRVAFILANDKSEPLEIRKVKSGCECIRLVTGPEVILPRGAGMFLVEFHAPRIATEYATEIVLFTSDSSRPMIPLSIRARIGLPLGFRPRLLEAGRIAIGDRRRKLVALVNGGPVPVRVMGSSVTGNDCEVIVPAQVVPAGGRVMVELTIRPAGPIGPRSETVVIETDSAEQARVALPVRFETMEGKARGGDREPRSRTRRSRAQLCRGG